MVRTHLTIALALALTATTLTAQTPRPVALRGVAVSSRGSDVVVTISGLGALPRPSVGVLQNPPRVYLDFPDVAIGRVPRAIASTDAPVVRVRVGAHTAPPATRVVIDLATPHPHRLEMEAGSVRVIVERAVAASMPANASASPSPEPVKVFSPPPPVGLTGTWSDIPRVPALTTPPSETRATPEAAKPATTPTSPPVPATTYAALGPPPPPADLERYRKFAWGALDRMRLQQPLLMSLDAGEPQNADRIQMAVAEFERLRQDLAAIKPPETLAIYHSMLVQSSTLGLMAFTLRFDAFRTGDENTTRNAASAAAGAILLLDRACGVLKCPKIPGR